MGIYAELFEVQFCTSSVFFVGWRLLSPNFNEYVELLSVSLTHLGSINIVYKVFITPFSVNFSVFTLCKSQVLSIDSSFSDL